MFKTIFGSKGAFKSMTFWGLFGTLGASLVGHFDPSLAPGFAQAVGVAGVAVTVLGLRKAKTDAVREIADLIAGLGAKASGGSAISR
jgi:hypothetical protein